MLLNMSKGFISTKYFVREPSTDQEANAPALLAPHLCQQSALSCLHRVRMFIRASVLHLMDANAPLFGKLLLGAVHRTSAAQMPKLLSN